VTTNSGVLVGESRDGIAIFKGVPYAQPPVGDLRWASPQPISWQGERPAKTFALPCLQPMRPDGRTAPARTGVAPNNRMARRMLRRFRTSSTP
jgi:carboxylesterase type B